ncbi:RodZ domain-containing protein [Maridesulfovibrio sp.]|uniref:helix-turn-helix domain-containing protein n=1 Tax=Maridesulfovibrio sp. TaxID=2795000 RepID=UPI002AA723C5|nr:RodZ domain-containing protein [Maridesulfovibrio sp.]
MDLKELGSRLKEERERQGLTVEQIMEITKVSRININAIENGDRDDFPHEVYAKGFIKNYAKSLGLNADEIGEEFSRLMASGITEVAAEQEVFSKPEYGSGPKKSSAGTIFLVLILVGIVGGLVYYLHDNSFFNTESGKTAEVAVVEETVEKTPAVTEQEAPASVDSGNTEAESSPAKPEAGAVVEEAVVEKVAEPLASQPKQEAAPVAAPVKNLVVITAKPGEACWMEAVVDGETKEYVLQEGDTLSLAYKDDLKIKLGNGGGVEIVSDGQPLEFDAPKGKVKKLEFSATQ